jgi:thiamine biosynthesis lipoprotein
MTEQVFSHQGLLGTVVEVRVLAGSRQLAEAVDRVVVGEVDRLERVFSVFDETSELCRWRRGETHAMSAEFAQVLSAASEWMDRSGGRFNPLVGELTAMWLQAESDGVTPSQEAAGAAAAMIRAPRFVIEHGSPVMTGDCSALNLNAMAKGFIVDRALDAAASCGAGSVCVNAGGDLAHRGEGTVRAGIENPHRPYDNEPPVTVIEVSNAALATSGDARRGFRVGPDWFGHVIDPRTGWPVDRIASMSVVAPDAMTADVVATVAGVRSPTQAITYLEQLDGVEGLVIDADGQRVATTGWASREVS